MNLLQRMKVWRELKRLEQRVRTEPAPNAFVDLGQVHINLDMHAKAERIAEDGLALFPRSDELRQLLECARRGGRRKRTEELRARLLRAPSPAAYAELAAVQVELGDRAGLQQTCQEWNLRFPGDAGSWLVLARAHLVNYYRDLTVREGAEAIRCLERALHIQPDDVATRTMFAELLYRIGAVQLAAKHLQRVLRAAPGDATATGLLIHLSGLADQGGDVQLLLEDVQRHGALRHPTPAAAAPRAADESLAGVRSGLAQVSDIAGVRKVAFIRGSKAMVKGAIRDGKDPFLRVARVVAKAAQRFARRLDIGHANKLVVDGRFGHVCVCAFGDSLAAAQCDPGANLERVLAELQEIVAGALAVAAR